jgi:GMP reductase
MNTNIEYQFSDIYLQHKKTIADSRTTDCDCSIQFGNFKFKTPIIPANMSSVVNNKTCLYLAKKGWFYINHRFDGLDNIDFVKFMHDNNCFASISIGVNQDSYTLISDLIVNKRIPEYVTIDIANGYSNKAEAMTKYVKKMLPETFLIVGNCATAESVKEIAEWGADAIKIGIANGGVCTTYNATGFGRPQFSTVLDCARTSKVPIISDGGCRDIGDFSKALVAGATMVMSGSMFAGFEESGGDMVEIENKKYKLYYGSASYNNKLHRKNVEGTCKLIPYKGSMEPFLDDIEDGLKSAISYAGGTTLKAFNNVDWVVKHK